MPSLPLQTLMPTRMQTLSSLAKRILQRPRLSCRNQRVRCRSRSPPRRIFRWRSPSWTLASRTLVSRSRPWCVFFLWSMCPFECVLTVDGVGHGTPRGSIAACVRREQAVRFSVLCPTRPRRRRSLDRKVRVCCRAVLCGEALTKYRTSNRLRQKIRVPYQSLQANVVRLQRVQQANDALRRTARFAVLAKRLEGQMNELGGYASTTGDGETRGVSGDQQEDKERTIAKAALSIAELSA